MDLCPICHREASIKQEEDRLQVVCETCGDYLITGECVDQIEYVVKATIVAKLQRWMRETKDLGKRMVSSAPMRMDDPYIREYVTLHNIKNMYLRKGTKEEYDSVLRKCLELQERLRQDCVMLEESFDIFPTADKDESRTMARKMIEAGDLGSRVENGDLCIYVTHSGQARLSS